MHATPTDSQVPRRHDAERALHLIDLENLCGDPAAPPPVALGVLEAYLARAGWRPGDQAVIAANARLVLAVAYHLPVPASVHAVSGTDAAEVTLLAGAPPEWVAARFGRLCVGSGDHLFTARVGAVRRRGVRVRVVSRPDALSRRLAAAASEVCLLPAAPGAAGRPRLPVPARRRTVGGGTGGGVPTARLTGRSALTRAGASR